MGWWVRGLKPLGAIVTGALAIAIGSHATAWVTFVPEPEWMDQWDLSDLPPGQTIYWKVRPGRTGCRSLGTSHATFADGGEYDWLVVQCGHDRITVTPKNHRLGRLPLPE
jgi:hypothetical protein